MHQLSASFVLGYHGCDSAVAKRLLNGDRFKPSDNDYDWLGFGVYFWEANPERGLEFAHEASQRGSSIKIPDVVGAILDLGSCLDLTTKAAADKAALALKISVLTSEKTLGPALKRRGPVRQARPCLER